MTTTNLGMTIPTVGSSADIWGDNLNADLALIDAYLAPGQFKATATNDSAATGYVAEYVSVDVVQGSEVGLVSGTAKTIMSISLTAGDWDVSCVGKMELASSPSVSNATMSISAVNNTMDFTLGRGVQLNQSVVTAGVTLPGMIPNRRFSLASTTTVYLVMSATFTSGVISGYGTLSARRER